MTKDEIIKAAASKLMGWKLPQDFCPDCYISFDSAKAKGMKSWPTGTNLLHVGQASAMFEACIGEAIDAALASARLQGAEDERELFNEASRILEEARCAIGKIEVERTRGAGYFHAEVDWLVNEKENISKLQKAIRARGNV